MTDFEKPNLALATVDGVSIFRGFDEQKLSWKLFIRPIKQKPLSCGKRKRLWMVKQQGNVYQMNL
jgi:hypothetical protein